MSDDYELLLGRGMIEIERETTKIVLRNTREAWLPRLKEWRAKIDDPIEQVVLEAEIRRLRRLLGVKSSGAACRVATRERVRRHRARKRQGIVLRPRTGNT